MYLYIIKTTKKMKAKFEIKNWLSQNREIVISKYEALRAERFFNGISLKDFMQEVLSAMERNNVKSEKRAASMLSFLIGEIYVDNSKVEGRDKVTEYLKEKYQGTAYMAMV